MPEQKPRLSFDEALAAVSPSEPKPLSFEDALAQVVSETANPAPSEGYWEDRGIAGKVWHPAKPPLADRKDANVIAIGPGSQSDQPDVFGISPDIAALGMQKAGTALVAPAANAVARGIKAGAAATGAVAPILGVEAVRHAGRAIGLPGWAVDLGLDAMFLRYATKRGGSPAAAEAEAKAAEATPLGFPKTTVADESPLELTRRLRDEWRKANPGAKIVPIEPPKPEVVAPIVKAAAPKMKLDAEETLAVLKMRSQGKTNDEIERVIQAARALKLRFGLSSDATVAEIVKKANESGRMVRP